MESVDEIEDNSEELIATLKSKFEELTKIAIQNHVAVDVRSKEHEIVVVFENSIWLITCPFCPQKRFKVVVERKNKCNITNIRNHFSSKHGSKCSVDTSDEILMKSNDEFNSPDETTSTENMRKVLNKSQDPNVAKDNTKQKGHELIKGKRKATCNLTDLPGTSKTSNKDLTQKENTTNETKVNILIKYLSVYFLSINYFTEA